MHAHTRLNGARPVLDVRSAIRDADGIRSTGIYLDMLLAADPILCWSDRHGHPPGDPNSWRLGIRALLQSIEGKIITEGCAEPYLDLVDYPLMHLYSQQPDSVPMWSMVYGDLLPSIGWSLPPKISADRFAAEVARAAEFGVRGAGSPWMTSDPEAELLTSKIQQVIRAASARH